MGNKETYTGDTNMEHIKKIISQHFEAIINVVQDKSYMGEIESRFDAGDYHYDMKTLADGGVTLINKTKVMCDDPLDARRKEEAWKQ
jgi:hypothetical protein